MEARPCSSVEGLCLALERAASGSDRDAASALPNLIRAAHREVGKLRHLAEALNAEIAFLQADAEVARSAASTRHIEDAREASCRFEHTCEDGACGTCALLRDQLEAVTAAYVVQGGALHRVRARLRTALPPGSQEHAAVFAECKSDDAAMVRATAQLGSAQKLREQAHRQLERELASERARSAALAVEKEELARELARALAASQAHATELAEATAICTRYQRQVQRLTSSLGVSGSHASAASGGSVVHVGVEKVMRASSANAAHADSISLVHASSGSAAHASSCQTIAREATLCIQQTAPPPPPPLFAHQQVGQRLPRPPVHAPRGSPQALPPKPRSTRASPCRRASSSPSERRATTSPRASPAVNEAAGRPAGVNEAARTAGVGEAAKGAARTSLVGSGVEAAALRVELHALKAELCAARKEAADAKARRRA